MELTAQQRERSGYVPYPYVRCQTSGKVRTGYLVCVHVVELGIEPFEIVAPEQGEPGRMVCAECLEMDITATTPAGEPAMLLWCAECAERDFMGRIAKA